MDRDRKRGTVPRDPRADGGGDAPVAVVGIDPGRNVGVAWVDAAGRAVRLAVVTAADLDALLLPPDVPVAVGDGTGSTAVIGSLRRRGLVPQRVDETGSTLEARALYFADHPPRGVRRLVPAGMRVPPRILDDYAAYAIARRYLAARRGA